MSEGIWTGIYIILGLIVFFRLFELLSRPSRKFQQEMQMIISSNKYKVKNKFEHE